MGGEFSIMKIVFKNKRLQKVCSNRNEAVKKYGAKVGGKLLLRLAQLQAFESLEDVSQKPPFRRHLLTGTYQGCFAVDLTSRFRLIFEPVFEKNIKLEDSSLSEIKLIMIMEVSNHYDD